MEVVGVYFVGGGGLITQKNQQNLIDESIHKAEKGLLLWLKPWGKVSGAAYPLLTLCSAPLDISVGSSLDVGLLCKHKAVYEGGWPVSHLVFRGWGQHGCGCWELGSWPLSTVSPFLPVEIRAWGCLKLPMVSSQSPSPPTRKSHPPLPASLCVCTSSWQQKPQETSSSPQWASPVPWPCSLWGRKLIPGLRSWRASASTSLRPQKPTSIGASRA